VRGLHDTLRIRCAGVPWTAAGPWVEAGAAAGGREGVGVPGRGAGEDGGEALVGLREAYIDVGWCVRVLGGAFRTERAGLLAYFAGGLPGVPGDGRRYAQARRLALGGVVEGRGFLRYVWPAEPASRHYWAAAEAGRCGAAERARAADTVATTEDEVAAAAGFLEAFDLAGCPAGPDEPEGLVLPVVAGRWPRSADARALGGGGGRWRVRCAVRCNALPPRLASRLAARLMRVPGGGGCEFAGGVWAAAVGGGRVMVVERPAARELLLLASTVGAYAACKEVRVRSGESEGCGGGIWCWCGQWRHRGVLCARCSVPVCVGARACACLCVRVCAYALHTSAIILNCGGGVRA
jgi:hypothetical protein